ncbi:MAG TPA: alpha/beta fold hydrolase [Bryobacteraceae bacterium]|nr:alpha/beta fold hydrolase [Bryobacteraceae bacterium]
MCVCAFAQINWDPAAQGRKALDLLLSEKYSELGAMVTPSARETLTPQFLRDRAGAEVKGFGKAGKIGTALIAKDGRNTLVSIPVEFVRTIINVQFTLNESGQVAGLFFRPGDAPLPPVWHTPAYSRPESFRECGVTVGDDEWKLGGTLLIPTGKPPFPAVVLVHGPGPNDRDEAIYSNKVFADIAEGLASRGIAVLRYDKRTKVYGPKMSEMDYTVQQETVEDAVRAAALLRKRPEIDAARVFMLGHSLGGYLAPRIGMQDGKLAGLIFLAANARPVEDMALDANEYVATLNGSPTPEAQKRLDTLRAEVAKVKALQPGRSNPPVLIGLPLAYLLDLKGYDAPAAAQRLKMPMLFLQGGRDFQVTTKDFSIWKSAMNGRANVKFADYPALNHLFIAGNGKSTPAEYRVPGNVSAEPVRTIADWVLGGGR